MRWCTLCFSSGAEAAATNAAAATGCGVPVLVLAPVYCSFRRVWDGQVLEELSCIAALPDASHSCINALRQDKHNMFLCWSSR